MSRVFMPGVGVDEPVPESSPLTVWPNPGTDRLHLQRPDGLPGSFELRDTGGRLVLQGRLASVDVTTINVSPLKSGVYSLIIISHSGKRTFSKWVKQ